MGQVVIHCSQINLIEKMIISQKKRFVFIKTMKTAGSSIEVYLAKQDLGDSIITTQFPAVRGYAALNHLGFHDHCLADWILTWMGASVWEEFYSFCVERDPWEKVFSLYSMHKSRGNKGAETFDGWLEQGIFPINYPIYTAVDNPNKIIVNRVLKYENLNNELSEVFRDLGIPFAGILDERAKRDYRVDKSSAHKIMTPKQFNLIGDIFSHEINLHRWYA